MATKRKPKGAEPETMNIEVLKKGAIYINIEGPVKVIRTKRLGELVIVLQQAGGGQIRSEKEDE